MSIHMHLAYREAFMQRLQDDGNLKEDYISSDPLQEIDEEMHVPPSIQIDNIPIGSAIEIVDFEELSVPNFLRSDDLKAILEALNVSQRELSHTLDVTDSDVSYWKLGKCQIPENYQKRLKEIISHQIGLQVFYKTKKNLYSLPSPLYTRKDIQMILKGMTLNKLALHLHICAKTVRGWVMHHQPISNTHQRHLQKALQGTPHARPLA